VPVAAIAVWITNPITFVPIFYLAYKIGAAFLDIPIEAIPANPSWEWVLAEISLRWKPLMAGSLFLAVSVASTAYLVVSVVWHISTVSRYRRRHSDKASRVKEQKTQPQD